MLCSAPPHSCPMIVLSVACAYELCYCRLHVPNIATTHSPIAAARENIVSKVWCGDCCVHVTGAGVHMERGPVHRHVPLLPHGQLRVSLLAVIQSTRTPTPSVPVSASNKVSVCTISQIFDPIMLSRPHHPAAPSLLSSCPADEIFDVFSHRTGHVSLSLNTAWCTACCTQAHHQLGCSLSHH